VARRQPCSRSRSVRPELISRGAGSSRDRPAQNRKPARKRRKLPSASKVLPNGVTIAGVEKRNERQRNADDDERDVFVSYLQAPEVERGDLPDAHHEQLQTGAA